MLNDRQLLCHHQQQHQLAFGPQPFVSTSQRASSFDHPHPQGDLSLWSQQDEAAAAATSGLPLRPQPLRAMEQQQQLSLPPSAPAAGGIDTTARPPHSSSSSGGGGCRVIAGPRAMTGANASSRNGGSGGGGGGCGSSSAATTAGAVLQLPAEEIHPAAMSVDPRLAALYDDGCPAFPVAVKRRVGRPRREERVQNAMGAALAQALRASKQEKAGAKRGSNGRGDGRAGKRIRVRCHESRRGRV